VIDYIDTHREVFGVEPICEVLTSADVKIAPRTYYAARTRPASKRALSDAQLRDQIVRVHRENFGVYGGRRSGGSSTAKGCRSRAARWSG
jgi:putative transposase